MFWVFPNILFLSHQPSPPCPVEVALSFGAEFPSCNVQTIQKRSAEKPTLPATCLCIIELIFNTFTIPTSLNPFLYCTSFVPLIYLRTLAASQHWQLKYGGQFPILTIHSREWEFPLTPALVYLGSKARARSCFLTPSNSGLEVHSQF